jgi:uncharacterized protein
VTALRRAVNSGTGARLARRTWRSSTALPSPRHWAETLALGVAAGAAGYALGRATGLFRPRPGAPRLADALAVLVVPALGEELIFRGALTPSRDEVRDDVRAVAGSTALFTLWHVLEAATFMRGARATFLRPDFLALAALEGVVCAWLRRRTGSIWPGVLLHAAEVFVWKTWLGGDDLSRSNDSADTRERR